MRRRLPLALCLSVLIAGCEQGQGIGTISGPTSPSGSIQVLVDVPIAVESTAGQVGTSNWVGQSVTMPAGGRYDTLRFNWYLYATNQGQPTAFGVLFILDRPYTGLPGDLGPSTPGFIAASSPAPSDPSGAAGQGGEYVFDDSVSLNGGTMYWFYTGTPGAFSHTFDRDEYASGQMYHTGISSLPFRETQASGRIIDGVLVPAPQGTTIDANFRLRGIPR